MNSIGLAIGAVPVVEKDGVIAVGFSCKTKNSQGYSPFGRSNNESLIRPSPLQLQRDEAGNMLPREYCMDREITTLVAADGEQSGPRVITTYNPLTTIPLGQNIDEKGMRSEEVVFFSVSSFADAKSVFPSGELVVVEIRDCQAFIEDWYIPPELLMAWAYSNDLGSPNPELNFPTVKGLVNMTVPAALITLLLAKVSRFSIPLIG